MSTDLVPKENRQTFQPIDQWFWPTSNLLSPLMDNNKSQSVNTITTTVATTSATTYHRRHRHWWKVCWVYNNGNFITNPSKQSNFRQFHQQLSSFSMCSTNTSAIFSDRCVNRDQIFSSMGKPNRSANIDPEVHINSECHQSSHPQYPQLSHPDHTQYRQSAQELESSVDSPSNSMSSCSPQMSSSATSAFLAQKLTQPLTALLRQKSEHKNSNNISNISQFFIHFKGPEWRAEQLRYQMPAHDIQMFKLQTNEVKFVRNQQRKAQIKPQLFLNKTQNYCFKCKIGIEINSYGVKISVLKNGHQNNGYNITTDDEENAVQKPTNSSDPTHQSMNGSTVVYHIQCFTCEECKEVLVDLKAFMQTNSDSNDLSKVSTSLYCNRHFVELYKPRCQFCDHLIFDEECTEAEGKAWHLGHFCCTECKRSLGGQQYIMANPSKQNDKKAINSNKSLETKMRDKQQLPYCLTCFDILFGELCEECGELIGCDVGAISHEGRSWHAVDVCFKCNLCSKALLGKPFLPAFDGRIYCSITCSQESIQRNRYRNRRRQKSLTNNTTNNNDLSKTSQTLETFQSNSKIEEQIADQMKPKLETKQKATDFQRIQAINQFNENGLPINRLPTNGLPDNIYPNHGLPFSRLPVNGLPNRLPINGLPDNKPAVIGLPVNDLPINGLPNGLPVNELTFRKQQTFNHQMNDFPKKFNEMHINDTSLSSEAQTSKVNDFVVSFENNRISPNVTNSEQNFENGLMNRKMFDYLQQYQQLTQSSTYSMEYMRQPLLPNEINGQNGIIGATIEYGSSLSEDERTNQQMPDHKTQSAINDHNYNQTSITSSTSSSLNITPFEPLDNNAVKANRLVTHSPSSNEATPLLPFTSDGRAQQLPQIQNQIKPIINRRQPFGEQLLPNSESPSQTSQADQSSNSSYIESNNKINSREISDLKRSAEVDSPSTQSTALQSSSQTTPETNPRSANKSVTFDPSVKETTGRRMNRRGGHSSRRSNKRSEWSDTQSCSTCSTCSSSSSSSDENFDYETTLERNRNQWLGGTKIHYVSNDRKRNTVTQLVPQTNSQSESCSIS